MPPSSHNKYSQNLKIEDSSIIPKQYESKNANIICPAGSFVNYDRTQCITCEPGRFQSTSGYYCSSSTGCSCTKC